LRALDPDLEVLYVGSGHALEQKLLRESDIDYIAIPSGKYRRYHRSLIRAALDVRTNTRNVRDILKVNAGYLRARRVIHQFKPDVIFVTGGYVGLPIGLAAQHLHIPIVLHEANAVSGLTNRLLGKYARIIATAFPVANYADFDATKLVFVGNPIREDILQANQTQAETFFAFSKQKPNILIFGGSHGAQILNDLVFDNLQWLVKHYNVIHVAGEQGIEQARFLAHQLDRDLQDSYRPYDFLRRELGLGFVLADLVICRSGANTVAELAAWHKPAILIPFKSAANNEQFENAQVLVKAGAARMLSEDKLSGRRLISEIDRLMESPKDRDYLQGNIEKFYKPDSAELLAKQILQIAKREGKTKHGKATEKR